MADDVEAVAVRLSATHLSGSDDGSTDAVGAAGGGAGASAGGPPATRGVGVPPAGISSSVPLAVEPGAGKSPRPPTWWERNQKCFKMMRVSGQGKGEGERKPVA